MATDRLGEYVPMKVAEETQEIAAEDSSILLADRILYRRVFAQPSSTSLTVPQLTAN